MLTPVIFEQLISKLEAFQALSPQLLLKLKTDLTETRGLRNQQLIVAGKKNYSAWFMVKGYAREISYDGLLEHTSWFFFENDFVYAYPSFLSHLPAIRNVDLLEDCTLIEFPYRYLMGLRQRFIEVAVLIDRIRDLSEAQRAGHYTTLYDLSPKERYDRFYADHRDLFNVARQKDIASFLGIKSDGLRRYRS